MEFTDDNEMIGRTFGGRYHVVLPVGSGIFADTFVADDRESGSRVALKIFDQVVGEDPAIAERTVDALAESALLDHPNIVGTLDWGIDGVRVWVATELCVGGSLRAMLDLGRALTPSQALVMALDCSRALTYAHGLGIAHRRIRPENILFDGEGRARLGDYGLADAVDDGSIVRAARAVDNVRYMSPEQAQRRPVDERTDVFALALVLHEAVTGVAPATAETAIGTMMLRAEAGVRPEPELGGLRPSIERCGQIDPDDRPEAEELTIALLAAAESMARPTPLEPVGILGLDQLDTAPTADPTGVFALGIVPPIDNPAGETVFDPSVPISGFGDDFYPGGDTEVTVPGLSDEPSGPHLVAVSDEADYASVAELDRPADQDDSKPGEGQPVDPVALESLDFAQPAFAEPAADPGELDVPAAAPGPATTYAPELDDADDRLPWWPLAVLGLLIAAGGLAAYLFGGDGDQSRSVPNLVGNQEQDVAASLNAGDWSLDRREGRQNGTEAGEIIDQDPTAGALLAAGESLAYTVSLGAELVEIPSDVGGLTVEQATARLQAVGLDIGLLREERSEQVDSGLVVGIDEPTRLMPVGSPVALRISLGPVDRVVPDEIVGGSIADATELLTGLRLQAIEEQVYDPVAEPGTVMTSDPPPGATIPANSQVTLFVSAGPEPVEMPDLTGLTLAEARDAVEELGLVFLDIEGTVGDPVIETIPAAEEIVDVGTEVTIVLGELEETEDGEPTDEG